MLLKGFQSDSCRGAFAFGVGCLGRGQEGAESPALPRFWGWGCHGDPQWLQRVLTFPRLVGNPQLQNAGADSHVGGINGRSGVRVAALLCCPPCNPGALRGNPGASACSALGAGRSWCSRTHPQGPGEVFQSHKAPRRCCQAICVYHGGSSENIDPNRNEDQGENRKGFRSKSSDVC